MLAADVVNKCWVWIAFVGKCIIANIVLQNHDGVAELLPTELAE